MSKTVQQIVCWVNYSDKRLSMFEMKQHPMERLIVVIKCEVIRNGEVRVVLIGVWRNVVRGIFQEVRSIESSVDTRKDENKVSIDTMRGKSKDTKEGMDLIVVKRKKKGFESVQ